MEVTDSDILPPPDWSSIDYIFEDHESWKSSLHLCYSKIPFDQFKKFKFVYEPDTCQQSKIKTHAAERALAFVMEKYDLKHADSYQDPRHREMIYSRANYFFAVLGLSTL